MSTVHDLKTDPIVWEAIASGKKRFEVRLNDRFYQRGDIVTLFKLSQSGLSGAYEWDYNRNEPKQLTFRIGWMLQGGQFGIEPKYVVFQLEPIEEEQK